MFQQSQQLQQLRQPQQPQWPRQLQQRQLPQPPGLNCPRRYVSFATLKAHADHIEESLDHNVCYLCPQKRDFETFTELQDHLENIHHYCEPCKWHCTSRQALRAHNISMHNMCAICEEYFQNVHELNGVSILHSAFVFYLDPVH